MFPAAGVLSTLTLFRHVLDDYTYTPDYLQKWVIKSAGGAGMEFHEFAHLDCPLDSIRESGHYIVAKWTDDARTAMQITAFKVLASLSSVQSNKLLLGSSPSHSVHATTGHTHQQLPQVK